jgi:hypothetical protein
MDGSRGYRSWYSWYTSWTVWGSNPATAFSLLKRFQKTSGVHPGPSIGEGVLSGEVVKRPRRGVDHSHPSNADVNNEWRYTSTSPICLNGVDAERLYISISFDVSETKHGFTKAEGTVPNDVHNKLAMDPMRRAYSHYNSNILAHAHCSLRI